MNTPDDTQRALIAHLADGAWTSGAAIADALQLSREAVSKRVRKLAEWGLEVESQIGKGYRLGTAIDLLDAAYLQTQLLHGCAVTVLPSIASTNAWASAQSSAPLLCLAEHQHAGRGRRGRVWQSPYGQNLYMSLRWELPRWPQKLPALSLALGVALARCLHSLNIPAQLKWPNDLYLNGRKFGGLLIEQSGEAQGTCTLVIGLGVNVAMQENADIDQAWTSLQREGYQQPRNALAAALANAMIEELHALTDAKLDQRLQQFAQYDVYDGCAVTIHDGQRSISGTSCGLDAWGRIQLKTERGIEAFSVGDVSLRASEH